MKVFKETENPIEILFDIKKLMMEELEAINSYENKLQEIEEFATNFSTIDLEEVTNVLKEITEDEYNHFGRLESLLLKYSEGEKVEAVNAGILNKEKDELN
jgi:rubrerythrin